MCLQLCEREGTAVSVFSLSDGADKQPEFAEPHGFFPQRCFDSCPALLIQRSPSSQEVSAWPHKCLRFTKQIEKVQQNRYMWFPLSCLRFSCDVHALFALSFPLLNAQLVFTSTIYPLTFVFHFSHLCGVTSLLLGTSHSRKIEK